MEKNKSDFTFSYLSFFAFCGHLFHLVGRTFSLLLNHTSLLRELKLSFSGLFCVVTCWKLQHSQLDKLNKDTLQSSGNILAVNAAYVSC